jgi:hypothetical protein
MATLKALERAAEQSVKEIKTTNREILDLIKTLKEIEELAGEADLIDLRNSTALKSSLKQLQDEVSDLTQNLKALDKELNDTNSKIRKALR